MMDNIIFFDPKMVPFDDFLSKSMKTKEKHWFLIVFLCFSLVLGDSSENHEMPPSSDRKNIYYPSSKKKVFLSKHWNTLKTSFLKCLRVCNFFFRNDVDVRNIEKCIIFCFCVRIHCSTSDLNSVVSMISRLL